MIASKLVLLLAAAAVVSGLGCAAEHGDASTGDDQNVTAAAVLSFDGPAPTAPVTVAEHDAKQAPASPALMTTLQAMEKLGQNQNVKFLAGTYAVDAALFTALSASGAAKNNAAYDVMFRIDGSKADSDQGLGFQTHFEADFESIGCKTIAPTKVLAQYEKAHAFLAVRSDDTLTSAQKRTLDRSAESVVNAFLTTAATAKLLKCTWDNHDDTDATAFLALDENAKIVRVLLAWAGG